MAAVPACAVFYLTMSKEPKLRRPEIAIILIAMLVGMGLIGADFDYLSLRPLRYLGINFPGVLGYAHFIVPAFVFGFWIILERRQPMLSAVLALFLCSMLISAVPRWADHQVEKVRINSWIDVDPLESRLGFKVYEIGGPNGTELWVAPCARSRVATYGGG